MFKIPPLEQLQACLGDPSQPIGARMRASYHLKQIFQLPTTSPDLQATIVSTLTEQLPVKAHGKLMRHEFGYVLGQLKSPLSIPSLCASILDSTDDCICRHECAEALGAICSPSTPSPMLNLSLTTLQKSMSDPSNPIEVIETCQIALNFISWKLTTPTSETSAPMACACMLSSYDSSDPAPPHPSHSGMSVSDIGEIMRDESRELWERYRAMFSVRNKGGEGAAVELGRALVEDRSSALFRHEVAFVLGQLQRVEGLDYLVMSLERVDEHEFVRHESAEAIGAIEDDWERCEEVLKRFLNDEDKCVRQSCEVALDAADYFGLNVVVKEDGDEELQGVGVIEGEGIFKFAGVKGTTISHLNIKEKSCGLKV
ncbi:hypothetical protein TrST_g11698 [Triparma strigata]|uniref:Deoxyhypusine monooxygenase n=1 Tax=Triparma strigata TaxID=1606541 RepID=A0A9W7AWU1_9STRA|nr:hypothetical protein TrST_g11698 [Triparma strigata]